jgi:DNA-binding NarL/FixJ family response regulator
MRNEIYIIGSRKLHNESLATLLSNETGSVCTALSDFDHLPHRDDYKSSLILIDYPQKDVEKLLNNLEKNGTLTALFNVEPGRGVEEKAIVLGIRGIFYEHDSLDQFRKGVNAIFNGELWISRDVMARALSIRKDRSNIRGMDISILTQREREILSIVVGGATNEEIANKLYISPHTVKTHIYNIFKKINVPNRLQAALWVSRNL